MLTGTRREDRNVVTEKETVGRSWMCLVGSGEENDLGVIGDGVRSTDGWMVVGWLGGWLSAGSKGGARSSFRGTVALRDRGSGKGEWGAREGRVAVHAERSRGSGWRARGGSNGADGPEGRDGWRCYVGGGDNEQI